MKPANDKSSAFSRREPYTQLCCLLPDNLGFFGIANKPFHTLFVE